MTSLSQILFTNEPPPPRATRVFPRLPAWLVGAINDAYPEEIAEHFGRRLKTLVDASEFLGVLERACGCMPFNHCGSDSAENFIAEPNSRTCSTCLDAARVFARRLGVRLTTSTSTWHAPESSKTIRFTFHKPEVWR